MHGVRRNLQLPFLPRLTTIMMYWWWPMNKDWFGEYLDYRTWIPRPVIGTQGLVATSWHRAHEQWGAVQMQNRFKEQAGRWMEEQDYGAYLAVRAIGEAASRTQSNALKPVKDYLLSSQFALQGYKGTALSFRPWDNQLRQPVLLAAPRSLVTTAPIDGFLHPKTELDTLGNDQPETQCQWSKGKMNKVCIYILAGLLTATAQAETLFVTLEKDNALALVDPIAGELTKTVEIGQRPRGILISPDHKVLYIAVSDDDTVKIIDTESLKEIGTLPSSEDPETFALNPKGDRLYVSNEDDSMVTVIDIAKKKVLKQIKVGVEPEGITVSPDNRWVVSATETTNMLHWIDTRTNEIVDNTLVDPRPRAVTFTADSASAWATSEMGGSLMVVDVKTKQITKRIAFEVQGVSKDKIQPVGVVIDKEMKRAYVALGPANRVAVVNAKTYEVEKYLLVGQRVWNIAFSPDQKRLYTTNGVSNDISIIDLDSQAVTKSVGVGNYPWGVAVKP